VDEETIFNHALGIASPGEREAFLDEVCAGDANLRAGVEALIRAHETPDSFLEAPDGHYVPASGAPAVNEGPGTVIGPYKLLQQIGEGGMGTVFMAEQSEPVRRMVALKIIKPGMDSRQVIARFEAERQALALMDHPNIAKVLDAGTTEGSRPYFVMELVKGVPITEFCDQNRLTPRQRLELFVPVCQAVQHAHQKGVIHRDLKPSNVMVCLYDGKPAPKVIDFGVAKATGQKLTDKTLFTAFGQIVGTFEYMSPEQAELNQLDIDTRSDIYSLGVLLYELLTGTTPLERKEFKEAVLSEVLRRIREEDPPKPSTRLSSTAELPSIAANRGLEPKKLSGLVRGELDWIAMKCLEKDRNRRYETVSALAGDIEHYLHDEPVEACPPSAAYRVKKLLGRYKGPVLAATVILLALVGGIIGTTWGLVSAENATQAEAKQRTAAEEQKRAADQAREEASRNFLRARLAVKFMLKEVASKRLTHVPGMTTLQQLLLEEAVRFYEQVLREKNADPEVRQEAAVAYQWLGQHYLRLGRHERAEKALAKAIDLQTQLMNQFPGQPAYRHELAGALANWAQAEHEAGCLHQAEDANNRALAIREKLVADYPKVPAYRFELALTLHHLAGVFADTNRPQKAHENYRKAVELERKAVVEVPGNPFFQNGLAKTLYNWGVLLEAAKGLKEAEALWREAVALHEQLQAEFPGLPVSEYGEDLAREYTVLGNLLFKSSGRFQEGIKEYDRALALQQKLAAGFPAVTSYQRSLAFIYNNLGLRFWEKRSDKAEKALREALTIREQLARQFPDVPEYQSELAATLNNLALPRIVQGESSDQRPPLLEARELLQQAVRHRGIALKSNPANPTYRNFLANHYLNLTDTLILLGDHEEAAKAAEARPPILMGGWQRHHQAARFLARCVALAEKDPKLPEGQRKEVAQLYAERAVGQLRQAVGNGFNDAKTLKADSAFMPLKGRDDFEQLVKELLEKTG